MDENSTVMEKLKIVPATSLIWHHFHIYLKETAHTATPPPVFPLEDSQE